MKVYIYKIYIEWKNIYENDAHTYIHTYTHIHTHIYIYKRIYTCIYIYNVRWAGLFESFIICLFILFCLFVFNSIRWIKTTFIYFILFCWFVYLLVSILMKIYKICIEWRNIYENDTHIYTYIHTYAYTYAYTYMHTYTYIHI